MRRGQALGLSAWVLVCILHAQCTEGIPLHSEDGSVILLQEDGPSNRILERRAYGERRSTRASIDQTLGESNLSLQPTDMQHEIDQEVAVEEATEREQIQKDIPVEDSIESKQAEMKTQMEDADMQSEIEREQAAEASASEDSDESKVVGSEIEKAIEDEERSEQAQQPVQPDSTEAQVDKLEKELKSVKEENIVAQSKAAAEMGIMQQSRDEQEQIQNAQTASQKDHVRSEQLKEVEADHEVKQAEADASAKETAAQQAEQQADQARAQLKAERAKSEATVQQEQRKLETATQNLGDASQAYAEASAAAKHAQAEADKHAADIAAAQQLAAQKAAAVAEAARQDSIKLQTHLEQSQDHADKATSALQADQQKLIVSKGQMEIATAEADQNQQELSEAKVSASKLQDSVEQEAEELKRLKADGVNEAEKARKAELARDQAEADIKMEAQKARNQWKINLEQQKEALDRAQTEVSQLSKKRAEEENALHVLQARDSKVIEKKQYHLDGIDERHATVREKKQAAKLFLEKSKAKGSQLQHEVSAAQSESPAADQLVELKAEQQQQKAIETHSNKVADEAESELREAEQKKANLVAANTAKLRQKEQGEGSAKADAELLNSAAKKADDSAAHLSSVVEKLSVHVNAAMANISEHEQKLRAVVQEASMSVEAAKQGTLVDAEHAQAMVKAAKNHEHESNNALKKAQEVARHVQGQSDAATRDAQVAKAKTVQSSSRLHEEQQSAAEIGQLETTVEKSKSEVQAVQRELREEEDEKQNLKNEFPQAKYDLQVAVQEEEDAKAAALRLEGVAKAKLRVAQTTATDKKHMMAATTQQMSSGTEQVEQQRQAKERKQKLQMAAVEAKVEAGLQVQIDTTHTIQQEGHQQQLESDLRISEARANVTTAEEVLEAAHENRFDSAGLLNSTNQQLVLDQQHKLSSEQLLRDYTTDINETSAKHVVAKLRAQAENVAREKEEAVQQLLSGDEETLLLAKQAAVEANTAAEQATEHAKDAQAIATTNIESKQQEIVQTKEKFAEDLDTMELKQATAVNGTAAEHRADEEDAIDDAKARVSRHNSTHQNALTSLEMSSKEQAMLRQTTAQDINAKQQTLQLASQALEAARDKMTKDSADSEAKSGDLKSLSAKMLRLQSNLEEAVEEEARMTKASQELSSSKIMEAQKKVDDARKRETHLNGMMSTAQTSFDGAQAAADKSQEIADKLKEELDLKTQEAAAKLAKAEEALSKLQPEDGEKTKGGTCQITMQANPQKPIVEERECTDPQDKLPFRCCNDEGKKTPMTLEKGALGEGRGGGALAVGGNIGIPMSKKKKKAAAAAAAAAAARAAKEEAAAATKAEKAAAAAKKKAQEAAAKKKAQEAAGGGYGCHKGSLAEAEQICSEAGHRLCSEAEMNECQQCDTGCMLDLKRIWTSASETQEENEDITQAKEKVQSKKLALDEAKINERKQNQAKQESVTDLRNDAATTQKELTEVQTDFNGATEEMRDAGKALQTVISKTNDAMERMAEEPSEVKELEKQVSHLKKQVKLATVVADEARARQQAADKLAESSLAEEKDALRNKEQAETLADTQLERAAAKISDAREDAGARHEEMKAAIKKEEELEIKRAKENAAELDDVKTDFANRERTLRTEYEEKFNTQDEELTTLRANEVEAKVTTEKAELSEANTFTIHNGTVSRADQDVAAAQAKLDRASGAAMTASKLQDDAELVADNFQTELEGQFMKIGAKDSEDALSVLGHKLQLAEQAVATLKANQAAHKKQDEEASGGVANALERKQESVTKMNSIQEMELQAVALANTRTALAEKQLSEARSRKTAEFTAMAVEENAAEAAIEAAAHAAIAKKHAHTMQDFNKMNRVYQQAKDAITAAEAELEAIESEQEAPVATAKMHVKEMSEHLKSLKAKVLDLKEQIAHIEKNRNGQLRLQRTAQANLREAERKSRTKIPSGDKLQKLEQMQRKQKMSLISASTHAGEVKFKVFEKRNAEAAAAAEMLSQKAGAMKKSAEVEAQKAAAAASLKVVEIQVSHAKAKLAQAGIDAQKDQKLEEAREAGFELEESQKMVDAEDTLKDKRQHKEEALKAEAASSSAVDELATQVQKLELEDQAAGTSREVLQEEHRVTKDSELLDEAEQLLRDRKAAIRQLREQMAGGGDGGVLHQMEDAKLAHTAEAAVSSTSAELQKNHERVQQLQQAMGVAKVGAKAKIAHQLELATTAEHAAQSKDKALAQAQQEVSHMGDGNNDAQSMAEHLSQLLQRKQEIDVEVTHLQQEHEKLSDRLSRVGGDLQSGAAKMQQQRDAAWSKTHKLRDAARDEEATVNSANVKARAAKDASAQAEASLDVAQKLQEQMSSNAQKLQAFVEESQSSVRHSEATVSQIKDQALRAEADNMNQVQSLQDRLEEARQTLDETSAELDAAKLAAQKLAAEHESQEAQESAAEKAYNFEKRAKAMKEREQEVQKAEQKARDSNAAVDRWQSEVSSAESKQEMAKLEEQSQLVMAQRKADNAKAQLKSATKKLDGAQSQVQKAQQGAAKALTMQDLANKDAQDAHEEAEAADSGKKELEAEQRQTASAAPDEDDQAQLTTLETKQEAMSGELQKITTELKSAVAKQEELSTRIRTGREVAAAARNTGDQRLALQHNDAQKQAAVVALGADKVKLAKLEKQQELLANGASSKHEDGKEQLEQAAQAVEQSESDLKQLEKQGASADAVAVAKAKVDNALKNAQSIKSTLTADTSSDVVPDQVNIAALVQAAKHELVVSQEQLKEIAAAKEQILQGSEEQSAANAEDQAAANRIAELQVSADKAAAEVQKTDKDIQSAKAKQAEVLHEKKQLADNTDQKAASGQKSVRAAEDAADAIQSELDQEQIALMREEGDVKVQQESLRELGTGSLDTESASIRSGKEITAMQAANVKSAQGAVTEAKAAVADTRVELQEAKETLKAAVAVQNMTATQQEALQEAKAKVVDVNDALKVDEARVRAVQKQLNNAKITEAQTNADVQKDIDSSKRQQAQDQQEEHQQKMDDERQLRAAKQQLASKASKIQEIKLRLASATRKKDAANLKADTTKQSAQKGGSAEEQQLELAAEATASTEQQADQAKRQAAALEAQLSAAQTALNLKQEAELTHDQQKLEATASASEETASEQLRESQAAAQRAHAQAKALEQAALNEELRDNQQLHDQADALTRAQKSVAAQSNQLKQLETKAAQAEQFAEADSAADGAAASKQQQMVEAATKLNQAKQQVAQARAELSHAKQSTEQRKEGASSVLGSAETKESMAEAELQRNVKDAQETNVELKKADSNFKMVKNEMAESSTEEKKDAIRREALRDERVAEEQAKLEQIKDKETRIIAEKTQVDENGVEAAATVAQDAAAADEETKRLKKLADESRAEVKEASLDEAAEEQREAVANEDYEVAQAHLAHFVAAKLATGALKLSKSVDKLQHEEIVADAKNDEFSIREQRVKDRVKHLQQEADEARTATEKAKQAAFKQAALDAAQLQRATEEEKVKQEQISQDKLVQEAPNAEEARVEQEQRAADHAATLEDKKAEKEEVKVKNDEISIETLKEMNAAAEAAATDQVERAKSKWQAAVGEAAAARQQLQELIKRETVAREKAKRHQAERVSGLREKANEHQESTVEAKADLKSLMVQVQELSDRKNNAERALKALRKQHSEKEASVAAKVHESEQTESSAVARASKSKEELYKTEMSTDTLEKMSQAKEAAALLTASKGVSQQSVKADEGKARLQELLGDIRTTEAHLDLTKQVEKTATEAFATSVKKKSESKVGLETAEASVTAAEQAATSTKQTVADAKQALYVQQQGNQKEQDLEQANAAQAQDTSPAEAIQNRADKLGDEAEKANAKVEATTEKKNLVQESLTRSEAEAKQVDLEFEPVLKRQEAAATTAAQAAEQAHQELARLKAKAALVQKQEAEAEAEVEDKSHVVEAKAAEDEIEIAQQEDEPAPWKSKQEIDVEHKAMRQIEAGRKASIDLSEQMAHEQLKKVTELEQTLTTQHHKRAPKQASHSDWTSWQCSVDSTQGAQIGVSGGGCHSALLVHTEGAEELNGACVDQFVVALATHYASALAQYSVDLNSCGSTSTSDSLAASTLEATVRAEEAAESELNLSLPANNTALNNTGLLQQVAAVKALASHEANQNAKVGNHVSESLRQAEEAMRTILEAKETSAASQTVELEKSTWQCTSDSTQTADVKYSSQPCTASASLNSSVGIGVFNRLGGAFSIQQPGDSLDAACTTDFRSHAAAQLSQLMLEMSQSVAACGPLALDANKESAALNEHSHTIGQELDASQARLMAHNPTLKQAVTVYRGVVQQLHTAKQELQSVQMLAQKSGEGTQSVTIAAAKVERLNTEAAKLRVAYIRETVAASNKSAP